MALALALVVLVLLIVLLGERCKQMSAESDALKAQVAALLPVIEAAKVRLTVAVTDKAAVDAERAAVSEQTAALKMATEGLNAALNPPA